MSNATFDSFKIPLEQFRKTTDSREWKHMAGQRRALYIEMASFTNADGTNAYPKISTLMLRLGWSHGKVCYILDDLKELGRVERTGRKGQRGPAIRKLTSPVSESKTQNSESPRLSVQSPRLDSESPKVNPESPTAIGRLTLPTDQPNKPAHLPAKELAGRMATIFGQGTGKVLQVGKRDQEIIRKALDLTGSEVELTRHWKHWLGQRNLEGLKYPLGKFLEELPGIIAADSSSEPSLTREQEAAIRANIDRQSEKEKTELDLEHAQKEEQEQFALANIDKWF